MVARQIDADGDDGSAASAPASPRMSRRLGQPADRAVGDLFHARHDGAAQSIDET
jgi:hypothetical protein